MRRACADVSDGQCWAGCVPLGLGGAGCRYSGQGRAGQSGMQATAWVSDTSVVCGVSVGSGGSVGMALTSGGSAGSMTEALSYNAGAVSGLGGTNLGSGAGGSVSVSGADLGTIRW